MRCWNRCIGSIPASLEAPVLASSRASSLPQGMCEHHESTVGASLLAMTSLQTTKSPQMITHPRAFTCRLKLVTASLRSPHACAADPALA
ncbi:hypothetical protein FHJ31_08195 [Pseudomonas sp. Fig-3]|nr:hypothetical protein FHJ31_08195 [Pseudomonas sp. Fig-3]